MLQKAEIPDPMGSPSLEIIRSQWNKALFEAALHRRVEYRNLGVSFEPTTFCDRLTTLLVSLYWVFINKFFLTPHV